MTKDSDEILKFEKFREEFALRVDLFSEIQDKLGCAIGILDEV